MNYLTAWEAHTGSVFAWLQQLLDAGDVAENDVVWSGPDGSYAAGDWPSEDDAEMTDSGTVGEWLAQTEA